MQLWSRVAHHHMLWSPCVGADKAYPMYLAYVGGFALKPLSVVTPKPTCLTLSHLPPPFKVHFRPFWKFMEETSYMLEEE